MSLSVLCQVSDEVRRLAIAGSALAVGDFRLQKLVPALEESAAKAPVFGKVAHAITKLINGSTLEAAKSLLELNTLTSAILYTQGETKVVGEWHPLETIELPISSTETSARVLKPLIEALTKTGSGRLDIIRDSHERGLFQDVRLVKWAIAAIKDPHPEIADFVVENVLPRYGPAIYPRVKADFDNQGKNDDGRRLRLLHQLDPVLTRPLVEQALDEGSKEVRLAAISCLEGYEEAIPFLLEQTKARAGEVRQAAFKSLALSLIHI